MNAEFKNSNSDILTTLSTMPYMLRVKDIQKIMGIGRRAAYRFVRNHECMIKVGKQMFIPKPQFEQWLKKSGGEKVESQDKLS